MDFSGLSPFTEPALTGIVAVAFCLLAYLAPGLAERLFRPIESLLSEFATHKAFAVISLFLLVIAIRLALLPLLGVPYPGIHDEFAYLLMGDTFVHGRLTNPTHPMWRSLETFHVLWSPTYAAKYPVGQGLVLALGQILGHPWIGVLLSAAAMCASILWMLQAWMPSRWALLGGLLAALKLCVSCYWMNGYWGGAVAAIGGALVLGALGRILRGPTIVMGISLGLGVAILLNTRPYEGFFLCLPVAIILLYWFEGKTKYANRSPHRARLILVPVTAIFILTVAFMIYYNWRVTGNAFLTPAVDYANSYERFAHFIWQRPKPMVHFDSLEMDTFFNRWARNNYDRSFGALQKISLEKFDRCRHVFFWQGLLLALPGLLFVPRDKRFRFLLLVLALVVVAFFVNTWPNPHYIAPITCLIFGLIVQALRHLRQMQHRNRPVGLALSRAVVLLLLIDSSIFAARGWNDPQGWGGRGIVRRHEVQEQLSAIPGSHLVVVKYQGLHSIHDEWVYNAADIDGSRIVWARDLGPAQNAKLFAYFKDRTIWLIKPGEPNAQLTRYPAESSDASPGS